MNLFLTVQYNNIEDPDASVTIQNAKNVAHSDGIPCRQKTLHLSPEGLLVLPCG
jgi:hypothetical protein